YATSKFVRESQERAVEVMREEYGHATAPPLERILIEQIIICWLRLNTLEIHYTTKTFESHTTETGLYWDRRLTNAQRRFTRACESLARVRRLARLNVQVNIAAEGGRQINLA
ncbi:MAG: hypothetical protein M3441_28615, partial [Chloroflexota bacterium]|nr:hypothetical protein [Chloroflexota bacterium]